MRVLSGSNPNGVKITSVFHDPVTVDSTGSMGRLWTAPRSISPVRL